MTWEEAKDQIAKKHRFKDWEDLVLQFQAKNYVDEAAILYAREVADKAWEAGHNRGMYVMEPSQFNFDRQPDKKEFMRQLFPEK